MVKCISKIIILIFPNMSSLYISSNRKYQFVSFYSNKLITRYCLICFYFHVYFPPHCCYNDSNVIIHILFFFPNSHLDNHELWVQTDFAIKVFKIIMFSVQVGWIHCVGKLCSHTHDIFVCSDMFSIAIHSRLPLC